MRSRSLIFEIALLLWLSIGNAAESNAGMFKFVAPTTDILKGSLENSYGILQAEEIRVGEMNVFYAIVDTASGTARKSILLYVRKSKDASWMLLLYRATNSSSVVMKIEENSLVAYSKSGKKILTLPVDSLNLEFVPSEQ